VSPGKRDVSLNLGVQRIEPVNLEDPLVLSALDQARSSLTNPSLKKILRVRTAIQQFFCNELAADGYVHPPIYMLAGCTDPLNHWTYPARINYYGEEVSVTQSLILQKLLMVMLSPADKVFWASPNIRMEMRISGKDHKYVTEFMQVDFEKRGATYQEMVLYLSALMQKLYSHLNREHGEILEEIRGERLPELTEPLAVFDAADVKRDQQLPDDDAVERWGAEQSGGKPFMVVNLKREAYDCWDDQRGRFLNYDVVVPPHGKNQLPIECLSGGERTRSLEDLERRMIELKYPVEYFAPFFELFSALDGGGGKITCAGAGFGIERLTFAILGLEDIHYVYPFPRKAEGKIAV
jgi:aspartyl/asparaginyl-tRNA synthetase